MEFISLGGLVRGLSLEAVQLGVSQSRNPNLAAIFYRLRLVASYGTGILPNRNEVVQYTQKLERTESTVGESIESEKQSILHLARQKWSISRKEVEDLVRLKITKAFRLLKELCDEGQLTQQVSGKFTRYIPTHFQQ